MAPHKAEAAFTASVYWLEVQPLEFAACFTDSTADSHVTGHLPPTATAKAEALASFPQESTAVATAVAYAILPHPAVAEADAAALAYPMQ